MKRQRIRKILLLISFLLFPIKDNCKNCKSCEEKCPMSLPVSAMVQRNCMVNSECILCGECVDTCPSGVVKFGFSERR